MTLPNYTQVSNEFLALLPELTGEEVKIFLAISRKTIGWHKESDRIAYSQLKKLTGIRHNVTLKKAAVHLAAIGLITISGDDTKGYVYDLTISSGDIAPISRRDTTKETNQKKQDSALSEREAPSGTSPAPIPFDLSSIRQDVAERGMSECAPMPGEGLEAAPRIITSSPQGPKGVEARLWAKFLSIQPDQRFPDKTYAKERKGVQRLVKEAFLRQPDDPEAWLGGYVSAWARLKRDRKTLIFGQPDTPAKMASGFMDYVIAEMAQAALFEDSHGEIIPF